MSIALLVSLAAFTLPSAASASSIRQPHEGEPTDIRIPLAIHHRWAAPTMLGDVARLSIDSLAAPRSRSSSPTLGYFYGDTFMVGDLDGDRHSDIVTSTVSAGILSITAIDGDTGFSIWSRSLPDALPVGSFEFGRIFPARVGLLGGDGLLVLQFDVPLAGFRLTAINGLGQIVWIRQLTGSLIRNGDLLLEYHIPVPIAIVHSLSRTATDLLVGVFDAVKDNSRDLDIQRTSASIINGQTGLSEGSASTSWSQDASALMPLGDVTGDDLDDYAFVTAPENNAGNSSHSSLLLAVHRGTDGDSVWQRTLPPGGYVSVVDLGDMTGYGRDDVGAWRGGAPSEDQLTLLRSIDGLALWTRPLFDLQILGDVDTDGRSDVGTTRYFAEPSRFCARYTAYDDTGATLYDTQSCLSTDPNGYEGVQILNTGSPGDVDADGIPDYRFGMLTYDPTSGSEIAATGIASGRTGTELWRIASDGFDLYNVDASISGSGDDLVQIVRSGVGADIAAIHGADDSTIWSTTLVRADPNTQVLGAGDLAGDGRADVLLRVGKVVGTWPGEAGGLVVLRGVDGGLAWPTT